MNDKRTYKWKRILRMALWSSAGIALFVLLLSAMHRNSTLVCSGPDILIEGYNNEMFISEAEVQKMVESEMGHKIAGSVLEEMDLRKLERSLQTNPWISKAQLFADNQQVLHINIAERMPVARVFTRAGASFYMDSAAVALPLSINEIADVPVFTNIPDQSPKMSGPDSLAWQQVSRMGNYIKKDSFLLMQLGQVELKADGTYTMYPAIGNHTIAFGTADQFEQKLKRLGIFYKKIFGKVGLNKYEMIDLRYDKQIVATLRGKPEGRIDSAAAMRKFEELVNRTVREANDTTVKLGLDKTEAARPGSSLAPTSLEPVDGNEKENDGQQETERQEAPPKQEGPKQGPLKQQPKPVVIKETPGQNKSTVITQKQKPMVVEKQNKPKPAVVKSKPKPVVSDNKQPKAIMPKQNDY
ncbi:MAG: hypothetical protein ABIX01_18565 [Chitinophagaceae bacterium]